MTDVLVFLEIKTPGQKGKKEKLTKMKNSTVYYYFLLFLKKSRKI